jgi:hypothetical protein
MSEYALHVNNSLNHLKSGLLYGKLILWEFSVSGFPHSSDEFDIYGPERLNSVYGMHPSQHLTKTIQIPPSDTP